MPDTYAEVKWVVQDVIESAKGKGYDMTEAQAHEFLAKYERDIRDRMTERGWDIIHHFLDMELAER